MDTRAWVNGVIASFDACDVNKALALLFRSRLRPASEHEIRRTVADVVSQAKGGSEPWSLFLCSHALFLQAESNPLEPLIASVGHFSLVFQEALQGSWSLPIVYRFMRTTFSHFPQQLTEKSKKKLEGAVNELQRLMGICQRASEKPPDSRLMGLVGVMNHLFRLYFRLNNLQLCVNLLKMINSPHSRLPALKYYPMSQQVELKYYEGRLSVYEQQIVKAEECLDFSFAHCLPSATRNKRVILQYLIPVKVTRGKFPTRRLLEKHSQTDYIPLLEALKQGHVGAFQRELTKNQDLFIKAGILIMVQNLQLLAYRNLFRKVYHVLGQSQIPLQRFLTALECVDTPGVSLDALECLLANLIYMGWVKGYISHEKAMIVLRRVNPFPGIREC